MKLDIPDEELTVLVASSCNSCYEAGVKNGERLLKPSGLLRNDLSAGPEMDMTDACQTEIAIQNMVASLTHTDATRRKALTSSFLQGYVSLVTDHKMFVYTCDDGIEYQDEVLVTASQVKIVAHTLCETLTEHDLDLQTSGLITFAYVAGTRFYRSVSDSMEMRNIFAVSQENDHDQ